VTRSGVTLAATVVASASQVSQTVEEEAVILELDQGTYYGLDPVGTRVWSLIQEPCTVADVCDAIVAEYDVARERCEADVVGLLEQLAAKNLIEVQP
jgi:hypothetical protein